MGEQCAAPARKATETLGCTSTGITSRDSEVPLLIIPLCTRQATPGALRSVLVPAIPKRCGAGWKRPKLGRSEDWKACHMRIDWENFVCSARRKGGSEKRPSLCSSTWRAANKDDRLPFYQETRGKDKRQWVWVIPGDVLTGYKSKNILQWEQWIFGITSSKMWWILQHLAQEH